MCMCVCACVCVRVCAGAAPGEERDEDEHGDVGGDDDEGGGEVDQVRQQRPLPPDEEVLPAKSSTRAGPSARDLPAGPPAHGPPAHGPAEDHRTEGNSGYIAYYNEYCILQ